MQFSMPLHEYIHSVHIQLFALKFDPLYTPAGLNTLDGNYAVFGYILEGADALDDLVEGDQIVSVKIVDSIDLKP
jgi:peptidylprolyl isomerase